MNIFGKTLAVFVGLALLGAMGFGAYLVFQGIVALFAGLDPQVATVTGIACLVALTAAWGIARGLRAAIRQNKAMALREEKTATYQLFVDYWQMRLRQGQARSERLPTELSEKLQALERLLAMYADPAVIRAHMKLRDLEQAGRHSHLRARFGDALVAIRKDLGAGIPSGAAQELERLLLQAPDAGGADETAPVRTTLVPSA